MAMFEHLASYSQYVIDTHDGSESQVQFTHSFSLFSTFMYICADWGHTTQKLGRGEVPYFLWEVILCVKCHCLVLNIW